MWRFCLWSRWQEQQNIFKFCGSPDSSQGGDCWGCVSYPVYDSSSTTWIHAWLFVSPCFGRLYGSMPLHLLQDSLDSSFIGKCKWCGLPLIQGPLWNEKGGFGSSHCVRMRHQCERVLWEGEGKVREMSVLSCNSCILSPIVISYIDAPWSKPEFGRTT